MPALLEVSDRNLTTALVVRPRVLPAVSPARTVPAREGVPWFSSAVLFMLVAGATFGFLYLRGIRSGNGIAAPRLIRAIFPPAGLGLRVEGQGDRLLLTWNRRSPLVLAALGAVLAIDDGAEHREIHLGSDQLADGSVLYRPASEDVSFRLEMRGNQGSTTAESIRVVDGGKPTHAGFSLPTPGPEAVDLKPPVRPQPLAAPVFVAAQPKEQVLPDLSDDGPEILNGLSEIDVQVRVDTAGHVRETHILTDNVSPILAQLVATAAEKWTFIPATRGGQAVESDHTIVFQFQPDVP